MENNTVNLDLNFDEHLIDCISKKEKLEANIKKELSTLNHCMNSLKRKFLIPAMYSNLFKHDYENEDLNINMSNFNG